jgi:hypothetical protein
MPCSFNDGCKEEISSEKHKGENNKKDCKDCPSFSACSETYGFISGYTLVLHRPAFKCVLKNEVQYAEKILSSVACDLFRPPRYC